MEISRIMENFALFSGMELSDAMQWLPLCNMAAQWVQRQLRPGVDVEANKERLALVTAAVANRQYSKARGEGDFKSMTVGDVKVESSSGQSASDEVLLQEMWSLCEDLLRHPAGDVWLCS